VRRRAAMICCSSLGCCKCQINSQSVASGPRRLIPASVDGQSRTNTYIGDANANAKLCLLVRSSKTRPQRDITEGPTRTQARVAKDLVIIPVQTQMMEPKIAHNVLPAENMTGVLQSRSCPRKSGGKIGILASRQTDRVM
jgi:hypothetical protein